MKMHRLKLLADALNTSIGKLEKDIGVGNSTLTKIIQRNSNISKGIVHSIIEKFPNVSKVWLETGQGAMFTEPTPPAKIPELHEVNVPYLSKEELDRIAGMKTEYATKAEVNELREMLVRLANKVDRLSEK
mgnify:CR=1 FL=1